MFSGFRLASKNVSPNETMKKDQSSQRNKKSCSCVNCWDNPLEIKKQKSEENFPRKEIDFKKFFRSIIPRKSEYVLDEREFTAEAMPIEVFHAIDEKFKNANYDFETKHHRSPFKTLKTPERGRNGSKEQKRIFKGSNELSDQQKMQSYLNRIDQYLAHTQNEIPRRSCSNSISPLNPKKSLNMSSNDEKENERHSQSRNLMRLSQKYLRSRSKSPENKSDISLGEFLCINCDEFIDGEEINSHFKTCEGLPDDKELILVNYKLEKIKTAILLNMKKESSLIDPRLEECLAICLTCIQKILASNQNLDSLEEVIYDLQEIVDELPSLVSAKNKVYITLIDRVRELANLKKKVSTENAKDYRIDFNPQSKDIRSLYRDRKIFGPPSSHIPFFEEKENGWDRFSKKEGIKEKFSGIGTKKERMIFRELDNFSKNEELILAKPSKISVSTPKAQEKIKCVEIVPKESENLKKIKQFLQEKEKQRAKFQEKLASISRPQVFGLQEVSQKEGGVFPSDSSRRKRFLQIVDHLRQRNDHNRKSVISNTELYEECQNNQIHENNWEGFVKERFQNIY